MGDQGSEVRGLSRITHHASRVMERADVLGEISEEPDRLTRRFATPAMQRVNEIVAGWMREAGMSVRVDHVGNLIGRYEGTSDDGRQTAEGGTSPNSTLNTQNSTLILGSHLDTVRDAGKYDGPLGVLVAIACVERLHEVGRRLPFAIEVVAFADEEGLRYGTAYLGSKVFTSTFEPEHLARVDADGISMADALRAAGGDPDALQGDRRDGEGLLGYCEVHIEQGPVLEREGLPVGVVTSIAGQSRMKVQFTGEAGHAGTVPVRMRRDALCAAAEFVLAVEKLARSQEGLVATVGQMEVEPGASNVIPGEVTLSLDARHEDDGVRRDAVGTLQEEAGRIGAWRDVVLTWQVLQENNSVGCAPSLTERLARAVEALGYSPRLLPSGAGHDAVPMSQITPIAMLFVRCKGGISHNPAESVSVEDVAVAIDVMGRFLEMLPE